MPGNTPNVSVENSFIGGLKTEFTGLNFPENACTDADNTVFTLIGDVVRREGFDFEENFTLATIDHTNAAINTYKWNNVGGDGLTQIVVNQIGSTIYFYRSSSATLTNPLSNQLLISTVSLTPFIVAGSASNPTPIECQFTDGNGYLFVFHPDLEPFYCTYMAGTITANLITLQIRDFLGIAEPGVPDNTRPGSLTTEHNYNLINQGWTLGNTWYASDNTTTYASTTGATGWSVQSGITGVTNGQAVNIVNVNFGLIASGIVTGYSGTSLSITVTSTVFPPGNNITGGWTIYPLNASLVSDWNIAIGNFPSNSDVWWRFKNTNNNFDPATTIASVTLGSGPAPKGFTVINAFNQNRSATSGIAGLTTVATQVRPRTGTWFQGRIWYTGVDDSQQASGDAQYYTWTENIYFSQTVVTIDQLGKCYQLNDPTSEDLFDLLPTDGGVITIQGSGSIYKLFPIQNGMLVFAANGIWFITGSQGIGFAANDYTITKISSVQAISSTSFVDILGFPAFWNEEGIYSVNPSQQGGLEVNNLVIGTIASLYATIPTESKKFARGAYDPINFVVQWLYRNANAVDVTRKYQFSNILAINTSNKAFYTYSMTFSNTIPTPRVNGIIYVTGPGGSTSPDPTIKYLTSTLNSVYTFTWTEERDSTYVDWTSNGTPLNYDSFFVTGYRVHGQAQRTFQMPYVYMYSRLPTSYKIQGIWDYATSGDSGRYSALQVTSGNKPYYGMLFRRHRIRGRGMALQIKVLSVDGQPFDIMGWSAWETINASV